jgi:hypothetical protein
MTDADPWAVASSAAHDPEIEQYPNAPATQQTRGRIPRWIALACFAAIAALNVVWALQPYGGSDGFAEQAFGQQHEYDFPGILAENATFFLASLVCVVLLALRRTRSFATGFGIGFCALWFATVFMELRIPHADPLLTTLGQWCIVLSQALALPALICLVSAVLREKEPPPAQRPAGSLRAQRRIVLLVGVVAAAAWIIGVELAWVRTNLSLLLDPGTDPGSAANTTCCSFSQATGYHKIDLICGAVMLLLLVVGAAVGRSTERGAAILAGLLVQPLTLLLVVAVQVLFPLEYLLGLQNPLFGQGLPIDYSAGVTYSPLIGYWLALAGFVLLACAMAARAVAGRRGQARYGIHPVPAPLGEVGVGVEAQKAEEPESGQGADGPVESGQ